MFSYDKISSNRFVLILHLHLTFEGLQRNIPLTIVVAGIVFKSKQVQQLIQGLKNHIVHEK